MKLVNNVLLAFTAEGIANSVALAHGLGLTTESLVEALVGVPSSRRGKPANWPGSPGTSTAPNSHWTWP